MLYEPLGWARTQFPDWPDDERQALAERTLRELFDGDLIFFFRVGRWGDDVNRAGDDERMRLSPKEVDAVISGADWRTVPLGPAGANVWFGPTRKGEETFANLPPHIKRFFESRWAD